MITIIVGIVCFYLGFFCCALLKAGKDMPRYGDEVDDAVYQHMEGKDE